ncbi:hypothetical protein M501DRAFT_1035378 [Patellaria atrata CBS 101060]|uniref:Uncharacterized protein n=1 Tax=Patellaria atrata CBS 101060 TaxID=1346257 RepID=A0A9P4S192_9PEZI|nr:hypothetical protein M501DRAFT_1035378 [Patellaria atrata CBS 101060]
MLFTKTFALLALSFSAVIAAPIANAPAEARDANPQSSYSDYGTYGDVPPPAGGYGSYDSVPPPAGGYGSYDNVPPADVPSDYGTYGDYGSYKRDAKAEAEKKA